MRMRAGINGDREEEKEEGEEEEEEGEEEEAEEAKTTAGRPSPELQGLRETLGERVASKMPALAMAGASASSRSTGQQLD